MLKSKNQIFFFYLELQVLNVPFRRAVIFILYMFCHVILQHVFKVTQHNNFRKNFEFAC